MVRFNGECIRCLEERHRDLKKFRFELDRKFLSVTHDNKQRILNIIDSELNDARIKVVQVENNSSFKEYIYHTLFIYDEIEGYYYRGIPLYCPEAALSEAFLLPSEYLHEIDAKTLYIILVDGHFPFMLPSATSIISSKLSFHSIILKSVTKDGVVFGNKYLWSVWR